MFNIQGLQVKEESLKVRNVTRQSGLTAFLAIQREVEEETVQQSFLKMVFIQYLQATMLYLSSIYHARILNPLPQGSVNAF